MRTKGFILYLIFIASVLTLRSQSPLFIRSELTPEHLVRKVLLGESSAVLVSNIQFKGGAGSLAGFSNSSKYYLIKKGIMMSTGSAADGSGPNRRGDIGVALGSSGSAELEKIATGKTYDACELSFDFVPSGDSISFNYIFASEEYPEYVNRGVNDIFAFFVQDLTTMEIKNLAVVGSGEMEVNIDNINSNKNEELYIQNGVWEEGNVMKWKEDPGLGELALTYEYDGFTTLLTSGMTVIPGRKYRIRFIIADVGDPVYDSAVFLEAGSFNSTSTKETSPYGDLEKYLKSEFTNPPVFVKKGKNSLILSYSINFDFDEFQTNKETDIDILTRISRFLKLHPELLVMISGHTDNMGSNEYNKELSVKRADFARAFMVKSGIDPSRLSSKGFGDERPVADNVTKSGRLKNRRIDFEFYIP